MKRSTIVVFLTLLLLMPSVYLANSTAVQKEENKSIAIEFGIVREDGSRIVREIAVEKRDISLFNEIIQHIFESAVSKNEYDIDDLIKDIKENFSKNEVISTILGILEIRPLEKKVFILSNGYGFKFDLQSKIDISFHKKFCFWLYLGSNVSFKNGKTIIFDPVPGSNLQFYRLIEGYQIGMMKRFTGFYVRIPGSFIEDRQSHIFFFGFAAKVRVIDIFGGIDYL